jgi:hypothetical protein
MAASSCAVLAAGVFDVLNQGQAEACAVADPAEAVSGTSVAAATSKATPPERDQIRTQPSPMFELSLEADLHRRCRDVKLQ